MKTVADLARPDRGPAAGLPLLEDLPDVAGRRVLVRVDFNVPLGHDPKGAVVVDDDFRIRAALPTLSWLTDRGAQVTACTHLGRPKGAIDERYDVAPVRARLAELAPGVGLLENLRFDPGEEGNDPAFVDRLVAGFDAYVNDAFGASHRSHASIVGPPTRLPSAAGRLLAREVGTLGGLMVAPDRPFVAVVGGAKVGEKLGVLRALLERVDWLVVGGGMAFTFLAAQGHYVGASLLDAGRIDSCAALLQDAGDRIVLPSDIVALEPGGTIGEGAGGRGQVRMVGVDVPRGWRGLDIGPESAGTFADVVASAGHGVLERAHGSLRGRPVLGRDAHHGEGGGRHQRLQHRGRGGLGLGPRAPRAGGTRGLRVDRRGSVARADRARGPARARGAAPRLERPGDGRLT